MKDANYIQNVDIIIKNRDLLIKLLDFALQDEYSELANMVTDNAFTQRLLSKIKAGNEIIELHYNDFEPGTENTIPMIGEYKDPDYGEITDIINYMTPRDKRLKLKYSQLWLGGGSSEEDGISMELYNYAINNLGLCNRDIPSFLGCTHMYETLEGDIYGFIKE